MSSGTDLTLDTPEHYGEGLLQFFLLLVLVICSLYVPFLVLNCSDLDIAKMQEAAGLFIGLKDFATFRNLRHDFKDLYTEREMYSVSIYHPANHHGSLLWHPYDYRILHIEFSARSYLYRQVSGTYSLLWQTPLYVSSHT